MWDDIEAKIRIIKRKRRAQFSSSKRLTPQPNFHFKRVLGEIVLDPLNSSPDTYPCQIVLNDFTPKGVYVYVPENLPIGTPIQIKINWSLNTALFGRIASCHNIALNRRIISEQNFPYRIRIEFQFQTDEEKERFEAYHQALMDQILTG